MKMPGLPWYTVGQFILLHTCYRTCDYLFGSSLNHFLYSGHAHFLLALPLYYCSAGIGRSGTFCLIDVCLKKVSSFVLIPFVTISFIFIPMFPYPYFHSLIFIPIFPYPYSIPLFPFPYFHTHIPFPYFHSHISIPDRTNIRSLH